MELYCAEKWKRCSLLYKINAPLVKVNFSKLRDTGTQRTFGKHILYLANGRTDRDDWAMEQLKDV